MCGGVPQLVGALLDVLRRVLHARLDGVYDGTLVVDHRSQLLEDLVHVENVALSIERRAVIHRCAIKYSLKDYTDLEADLLSYIRCRYSITMQFTRYVKT